MLGKNEDTSSSVMCIINVPLSLTLCSGRERQSVFSEVEGKMKTPVVHWHALIIDVPLSLTNCVVEIDKKCVIEVEGKNEDTSGDMHY